MRWIGRTQVTERIVVVGSVLVESVCGAALIGANVIASKPLRRWRTRWGATEQELNTVLPGDDLVPHADWAYTHVVTVHAPPEVVWPWVVQIGQGRGGFYSYQGLENLIGCRIRNTDSVIAEHQQLRAGDTIMLHPAAPGLPVAEVEENSHLVLHPPTSETASTLIWSFHLLPGPGGTTRLLERGRYRHGPALTDRLSFGPTLLEPVSFVMSRKMLLGIRARAERRTHSA